MSHPAGVRNSVGLSICQQCVIQVARCPEGPRAAGEPAAAGPSTRATSLAATAASGGFDGHRAPHMLVACAGSSCVEVRRLSRGLQDLLRPPRQRAALELLALVGADRGYHLVSHERREKPPRSLLLMIRYPRCICMRAAATWIRSFGSKGTQDRSKGTFNLNLAADPSIGARGWRCPSAPWTSSSSEATRNRARRIGADLCFGRLRSSGSSRLERARPPTSRRPNTRQARCQHGRTRAHTCAFSSRFAARHR